MQNNNNLTEKQIEFKKSIINNIFDETLYDIITSYGLLEDEVKDFLNLLNDYYNVLKSTKEGKEFFVDLIENKLNKTVRMLNKNKVNHNKLQLY